MKRPLLIGLLLMAVVLVPLALADEGKLTIEDIEFRIDGDRDSGTSADAKPGSTVKIEFQVKNNYPDVNNESLSSEIESIEGTVTIEGIDDGDDLEEDFDVSDLDAQDDKKETVTFEVPLLVDEDDYQITIEVEGEDVESNVLNSTGNHKTTRNDLNLEIKKEKHDVQITRAILLQDTLSCSRSTTLSATVINLGEDEEEDIQLTVSSQELDISRKFTFDLPEGDDDDTTYSTSVPITIGEDVKAGSYLISVFAEFDNLAKNTQEVLSLKVEDCAVPKAEPVVEEEEEEPATVIVTQPDPIATQPQVVTQPVLTPPTVVTPTAMEDEGFFTTPVIIGLFVVVNVLLIVVAVVLVLSLRKK